MTRVRRRAAPARAVRAHNRVPKPKLQKHKIIMENVTQEKKKLRSVVCVASDGESAAASILHWENG